MKTIAVFLTFVFYSTISFAQSFVIHDTQGNNVTGSNLFQSASPSTSMQVVYYVINVSSSSKSVKACRNEISIVAGTQNAITFNSINYPPSVDTSIATVTLLPGDSEYFEGDYFPNDSAGTSIIQYCFFDPQNTSDQSCLTDNFQAMWLGIPGISFSDVSLSFYPQPSSQIIHCISPFNDQDGMQYAVYNCSGKMMESQSCMSSNELSIDVSNFEDGIYFIEMISQSEKRAAGKILVTH